MDDQSRAWARSVEGLLAVLFRALAPPTWEIGWHLASNCGSAWQPADFDDNDFGITCPDKQSREDRCMGKVFDNPPPGPFCQFAIGAQAYLGL